MADVRSIAGGGPEVGRVTDSLREYQEEQERRLGNRSPTTPLESYPEFMQRRAQEAAVREATIAAQDMVGALNHAARQDGPHGAMLGNLAGGALGYGVAQQLRAPGKMFSRSDILAIVRAEIARGSTTAGLYNLLHIFENLE